MKKKTIGLFFGSFNPVHTGHLIIANYMANYTALDEVWFVVSPQNPFKEQKNLANMYDRLEMVSSSIEGCEGLRVSDIEFALPKPSYTIDTLTFLSERYPSYDFALIMGTDNLVGLRKWKNGDIILRDYQIYVYPRFGYDGGELAEHPSVTMTETPKMEISSTAIRQAINAGKSVRFLLPDCVIDFIDKKGLYS